MPIDPRHFLALVAALTLLAFAIHRINRSARRRALRQLARERDLQYAEEDLFEIARRMEKAWPIADCSHLSVCDILYGSSAGLHRYFFTVHFTLGPVDRYRRESRVGTCAEPCERCAIAIPGLTLAEPKGKRIEQYRRLIEPGR